MARVLVVDDERSIRRTLGEFLRTAGHEVWEAEDAQAALGRLKDEAVDVVVTDIVLPRISGVQLLEQIRGANPYVMVVMMTGEPTVETASDSLRAGAVDYLAKPITKGDILRVVANAARIKALSDEKARLEAENQAYQQNLEQLVVSRTAELERELSERKRAEQELQAALIKYRTLFSSLPLGVAVSDREGKIVEANFHAEKLLGIASGGQSEYRLTAPNWRIIRADGSDLPLEEYASTKALQERRPVENMEMGIVKPNTEVNWLSVTAAPIPLPDLGVVITLWDIGARKRLDAFRQALLSLGVRLNNTRDPKGAARAFLETADHLWKWDSASVEVAVPGTTQFRNLIQVDILDGTRQEIPSSPESFSASARMQRVINQGALLILRDTRSPVEDDASLFGDTSRRSASIMTVPIRREGAAVGLLSVQSYTFKAYLPEDLQTLQALADYCGGALYRIWSEDALRQSEERYRGLVETTCDWIWEVDTAARYTYVSPRVQAILGLPPAELLGKTPFDFMEAAEAERIRGAFEKIILNRQSFSAMENTCLHKDGHPVILESSGVPILSAAGELQGYRGMDRDVTERKRLELLFRQAQKLEAIGQLAGGVAHDFNNILAAILMQLSLLKMTLNLDENTRKSLNDVETEARRAANLTRQLLMFSRRSVLAVKPVNPNELVANLLKMLGRLIGEHIKLRFEAAAELPSVEADTGMLEQVLMNLVVNARDAMPKGGQISIRTGLVELEGRITSAQPEKRDGRFVCLTIADQGCGMDPQTLKRIFEPFFSTKEPGKGTGLGLATVHGIVAQHKGWVEVESAPGQGTTFKVFLPAAPEMAPLAPNQETEAGLSPGNETLLVVEDDETLRRSVVQLLRLLGYRVYEAANGQQALKVWQQQQRGIDLLMTDMVMPEGMTGLELVEKLQSLKPELKAVISSGYSLDLVKAGISDNPGIVYLPKPCGTKQLSECIRKLLSRPDKKI